MESVRAPTVYDRESLRGLSGKSMAFKLTGAEFRAVLKY